MQNFAELMRRLLEIQSHEGQRGPELIAEDTRLMNDLQRRSLERKAPTYGKAYPLGGAEIRSLSVFPDLCLADVDGDLRRAMHPLSTGSPAAGICLPRGVGIGSDSLTGQGAFLGQHGGHSWSAAPGSEHKSHHRKWPLGCAGTHSLWCNLLRLRSGRFGTLWLGRMWVGLLECRRLTVCPVCGGSQAQMEIVMAKVIEFYVPAIFRKPLKGAPQQPCGKVIEFCTQTRKSA